MRLSVRLVVAALLVSFGVTAAFAVWQVSGRPPMSDSDAERAFREAAQLGAERSWALALERLAAIDESTLDAEERRWLALYRADASWRALAADRIEDPSRLDAARAQLGALVGARESEEDRDRVWAEANESLGDSYYVFAQNPGVAFRYYSRALEWWAKSTELELAREKYLGIVRKLADESSWSYYARNIPLEVLENAVRIARDPGDRAKASYLLAVRLADQGGLRARDRVESLFSAAVAAGRGAEEYDDALFHWAQWLERQGGVVRTPDGTFVSSADPERALALYRRLVSEFEEGTSRWWSAARERIREITQPSLEVAVSNVFLPGSHVRFHLASRNVESVAFSLSKLNLTRDVESDERADWLTEIDSSSLASVARWSYEVSSPKRHLRVSEQIAVPDRLPIGAYLLEAKASGVSARELILVTDMAIVVKSGANGSFVYVTDAETGEPVAGADVATWFQRNARAPFRKVTARTGSDGTARLDDAPVEGWHQRMFAAVSGDRQAIARSYASPTGDGTRSWRIFTETDRPVYRPSETVNWKITARTLSDERYSTPAGEELYYRIHDHRGNEVDAGTLRLNEFGSAWGELELASDAPLSLYTIRFATGPAPQDLNLGSATLFRVEEYKLPEFRVTVTPLESSDGDGVRPGDELRATIEVEYYFGGPVRNAAVEAVVRQRPFHVYWASHDLYEWLRASRIQPPYWSQGQEIVRQTLTTDDAGRAILNFEVPAGIDTAEFTIEARVSDSSRREVIGTGSVRVSGTPFFARLEAERRVYAPGGRATVTLETKDINGRAVPATGRLTITREQWREVWLSPDGRRFEGERLEEMRRSVASFPPPQEPDEHGWKLIHRGYERTEIGTVDLDTDAEGRGSYTFSAEREGFYRFAWSGHRSAVRDPSPADTVHAETVIWVATGSAARLGYNAGALEIIADPGSLRTGTTTPVLIAAPTPGHHVLFTVETDEVLEHRVIHMRGTAQVIELPIDERFVPNVFLSAVAIRDLQMHADSEEISVPPVEQLLEVEVSADAEEYRPGTEGELTVKTTDHEGRPVAAELSLSVADESVFYIQDELSADPRVFFYGDQRRHQVRTNSSFELKRYALVDEQDERERQERARERGGVGGVVAGVVGGVEGDAIAEEITVTASAPAMRDAPPPPPAMVVPQMKAEDPGSGDAGQVRVRSDFRTTAFWRPDVRTGADGMATVTVRYPDSLTSWRATARAATQGNAVGLGSTVVRTDQPLTVRVQAPRFFVAGDESRVSALIGNHTDAAVSVTPSIEIEGLAMSETLAPAPITIDAGEERLVEWRVSARSAGRALIRMAAEGSGLADAVQREIPVYEHGIEKLIAASGKVRTDSADIELRLPSARREGSTRMELAITPSVAVTMVDALPYLIEFPYGCTEQTMSRFLPAAIVTRTLDGLGVNRADIARRLIGGVETGVAEDRPDRAAQLQKLDDVTTAGLARLYEMQRGDGSWGWWKDGEADPWMTAYVVWGFALARDAGIPVRDQAMQRAVAWLDNALVEAETQPDLRAWMLHALTSAHAASNEKRERAFRELYAERDRLSSYARALLALSAHHLGHAGEAMTLVRNLENGARRDESPESSVIVTIPNTSNAAAMDTVHWGSNGSWWRWFDSPVESTAFVLRALATIDPNHRLIEPSMNWLVKNRRGSQWSNTRDTAIAVLALDEYLHASGELAASGRWTVEVNGRELATREFAPADVFTGPATMTIPSSFLRDGANHIRIARVDGSSPLYFALETRFFSEEEPVTAAANEIFVRRDYYRIVPTRTLLAGYVDELVPLRDGEAIASGDRVEVVVTVETKNDYEYLIFEDLKPAGLEAVEVRSGTSLYARRLRSDAVGRRFVEQTANASQPRGEDLRTRRPSDPEVIGSEPIHMELRDRKVALFADELPQGVWEIRYSLRAEVPGRYHALPLVGQAMYVPEIRANTHEQRVVVSEEGTTPVRR